MISYYSILDRSPSDSELRLRSSLVFTSLSYEFTVSEHFDAWEIPHSNVHASLRCLETSSGGAALVGYPENPYGLHGKYLRHVTLKTKLQIKFGTEEIKARGFI